MPNQKERKTKPQKGLWQEAQAAVEYIILLGLVAVIVVGGWSVYLRDARLQAESIYNSEAKAMMGDMPVTRDTQFDIYP